MSELLILYWPSILAAALTAAALSIAGAFLVTRQAGVQILAVSQSAGLGVSLGLLIVLLFFQDNHIEHTVIPLVMGLIISILGFISTDSLAKKSHSPTVIYLSAFALFWGLSLFYCSHFSLSPQ